MLHNEWYKDDCFIMSDNEWYKGDFEQAKART